MNSDSDSPAASHKTSRQKFTPDEDARLVELVKIHGNHSWKKIATIMKTRSTRQCRERYINYLSPNLTNGPWSAHEDKFLIEKVKEMGPRWSKIVRFFPTRSDVNIKNRYALFASKGKAPPLKSRPREAQKQKPENKKASVPKVISVEDIFKDVTNEIESLWDQKISNGESLLSGWEESLDYPVL